MNNKRINQIQTLTLPHPPYYEGFEYVRSMFNLEEGCTQTTYIGKGGGAVNMAIITPICH